MRFLCVLFIVLHTGFALKFLAYHPIFFQSHVNFVGNIVDVLANAGHQVMTLEHIANPNITSTGYKNKTVKPFVVDYGIYGPSVESTMGQLWVNDVGEAPMAVLGDYLKASCERMLLDNELMDKLKAEDFDLAFSEWFDVCGHGIFKKIGVEKYLTLYSSNLMPTDMAILGISPSISYIPFHPTSPAHLERSIWNRFTDLLAFYGFHWFFDPTFSGRISEAYRVFQPSLDYKELIARSQFVLVNTNQFYDYPQPISHKVVRIGGLGMNKETKTEMDKQIQAVFDRAVRGVVYVSFGSMAKSKNMPAKVKENFVRVFKEFPDVQFIWKYENVSENPARGLKNVYISEWLPQRQILSHPKTLAFVTHGGMNSLSEATFTGTPMVSIPLFGDQPRNMVMACRKGIAVGVQKRELADFQTLSSAIKTVIQDSRFKERALNLSQIIRNEPGTPEERLRRAAEFAAQFHLHEHLDLDGRQMSAVAFHNLDVFALIALIGLTLVALLASVAYFVIRAFKRNMFVAKQKTG